jgi:hypothetical protein
MAYNAFVRVHFIEALCIDWWHLLCVLMSKIVTETIGRVLFMLAKTLDWQILRHQAREKGVLR